MTIQYEEVTISNNELNINYKYIKRTDEDGKVWSIPTDPANSDYQAYLAYVANGNQVPTLASELSNPSTPQAGE